MLHSKVIILEDWHLLLAVNLDFDLGVFAVGEKQEPAKV